LTREEYEVFFKMTCTMAGTNLRYNRLRLFNHWHSIKKTGGVDN